MIASPSEERGFRAGLAVFWMEETNAALIQGPMRGGWATEWDPWRMGWLGPLMSFILYLALFIGIIVFVRWLVRAAKKTEPVSTDTFKAMEILEERYARGEIDRDEFERKRRDLAESRREAL